MLRFRPVCFSYNLIVDEKKVRTPPNTSIISDSFVCASEL